MQAFREAWQLEGPPVWKTVFEMHREKMQIKNEKIAVANLENIFTSTFKLTGEKGFQAMSLRDLSRETGISMGGLYAYIGSKDELASVIEDVLRHYIQKVLGSLAVCRLTPVQHLRAIIHGEAYMNEIMNPWFYFCFMELKGLPREQQLKAMDIELQAEAMLVDNIQAGIQQGIYRCEDPRMLATQVVGVMQQWYLKRWKYRRMQVGVDEFANSVMGNLLKVLDCGEAAAAGQAGTGA